MSIVQRYIQREFLKIFGQPERQTVCACERTSDSNLGMAIQFFNGPLNLKVVTRCARHGHESTYASFSRRCKEGIRFNSLVKEGQSEAGTVRAGIIDSQDAAGAGIQHKRAGDARGPLS